ncbi:hypothetical protein OEG84_10130 [Hoeflea sp. G2-23]|uniref:Transposase n=1 Tax=Hoeflea algicola TaxID=2983763 RepID=A0ABT3Z8H6_9HYPH|nr:hypothetical protein [Hoeflea algicola]MCY0148058.1 hypothetical protein [Hoeflea algicola]
MRYGRVQSDDIVLREALKKVAASLWLQAYIGVDVAKDWNDVFTASNQRFTRVSNRRGLLTK